MNANAEPKYYSEAQLQRAAKQIELWCEQLSRAYRRDLWEIAKVEGFAHERLAEPDTSWGAHATARAYLEQDAPKRRRWLHAALHILDYAGIRIQIDFVLGDQETRDRLVNWVQRNGGIYDRASGRTPAYFVELPE